MLFLFFYRELMEEEEEIGEEKRGVAHQVIT
jgi:hypothetical protein